MLRRVAEDIRVGDNVESIVALTLPFPGVSRVFEEAQKLNMLKLVVVDGEIALPPARVYILGAWAPIYSVLLSYLPADSKVGILWTSSCGELSLEPIEQDYLSQIDINPRIKFIWFGDPSLAQVYSEKGFYAPYPLKTDVEVPHVEKQNIVTLFCPPTLKKNILVQLVAITLLQRTYNIILHTNVPIDPRFAERIGLKFTVHPWMQREEYDKLIASSKLNFAVSLAETLNYQSAEAALLGTASVVSHSIPWMKNSSLPIVQNANDPLEIALVAGAKLDTQQAGQRAREVVLRYFEHANTEARFALSRLILANSAA